MRSGRAGGTHAAPYGLLEALPSGVQADSRSARIQLCAQALCLEEMLQVPVPTGAVFDGKAKRREVVLFDEALCQQVETLAARMHQIFQSGRTPPAVYAKKCDGCSMNPVCLPSAVASASASRYLARAIGANLKQASGESTSKDEET